MGYMSILNSTAPRLLLEKKRAPFVCIDPERGGEEGGVVTRELERDPPCAVVLDEK